MQVLLNNRLYQMSRPRAEALAHAASDLVPVGIYAVSCGEYMELRNDPMEGAELEAEIEEWERRGFEVHANR